MTKILLMGCVIGSSDSTSITVNSFFSDYKTDQFVIVSLYHDILLYYNDKLVQELVSIGQVWDLSQNRPFTWEAANDIITYGKSNKRMGINRVLIKALSRLEVNDVLVPSKISKELLNFLHQQNVALIYSTLSNYYWIKEVWKLQRLLNVNVIIHFFDNWLEEKELAIKKSFLKKMLAKKWFNRIFLFKGVYFCISSQMQKAYKEKYNLNSRVFFNTVELDTNFEVSGRDSNFLKIGYFGRIGRGNVNAISYFSRAVSEITAICGLQVVLDLFINSGEYDFPQFRNVNVCPSVRYIDVFHKIRDYDFLLLPLDAVKESTVFIKYSIPTKFADYASSGVPIISFGPLDNAVNTIIFEKMVGFFIPYTEDIYTLKEKIEATLLSNLKNEVAFNAREYIKHNFSKGEKMREIKEVIESLKISW